MRSALATFRRKIEFLPKNQPPALVGKDSKKPDGLSVGHASF